MNRLISFDFSGTLAQRNTKSFGWEFVHADTVTAIHFLKLAHPELHFAVTTNGNISHPADTLTKHGLREVFTHQPSGASLILGAHTDVILVEEQEVPVKQSLADRLRNIPTQTIVQKIPVEKQLGPKPLPDMLHYAMEVCGVENPAHAVHIGDDVDDAMMARNANTHFMGVWPLSEVSYINMAAVLARATQLIG